LVQITRFCRVGRATQGAAAVMLLGRRMTPSLPTLTGRARAKALGRSHALGRRHPPTRVHMELAVEEAVERAKAAHPSKSSGRTERRGRMRAPAVDSQLRRRGTRAHRLSPTLLYTRTLHARFALSLRRALLATQGAGW
jgi:hypothetical protein